MMLVGKEDTVRKSLLTELSLMVLKPIGWCVKVKFTIVPILWGGLKHSLRYLRFFVVSVRKEDTGVGLT